MNSANLIKISLAFYICSASAYLFQFLGEITPYGLFQVSWLVHELIELATLFGFALGTWLIWRSHQELLKRNHEVEHLLRATQGEFSAMLQAQFGKWGLSKAERDIALLTIKGLTVAEIADARSTSQGTVKSQNNTIYRKADVKNRTQLLGAVIDELFVNPDVVEPASTEII